MTGVQARSSSRPIKKGPISCQEIGPNSQHLSRLQLRRVLHRSAIRFRPRGRDFLAGENLVDRFLDIIFARPAIVKSTLVENLTILDHETVGRALGTELLAHRAIEIGQDLVLDTDDAMTEQRRRLIYVGLLRRKTVGRFR